MFSPNVIHMHHVYSGDSLEYIHASCPAHAITINSMLIGLL
jgi:hypothetical protein